MKIDEYKTKDIFEASWLYLNKAVFIGLEPCDRYYYFVFTEKNNCASLSEKYWSQKGEGNIKEYVNSLKTLKDLVFSKRAYET